MLCLSVIFLISCKTVQVYQPFSPDSTTLMQIDSVCMENLTTHHYPGLAVAVIHNGRIWTKGYGYADLEKKIPVDPNEHLFRIGSISKTITASALARLYEQDKIELDVPIGQYVRTIPSDKSSITLRQLGGHMAGIRHYNGLEFFSNLPYASVNDAVEVFIHDTLLSEPGQTYYYTTYGWTLLSAVMEDAVDKQFLQIIDKYVRRPLLLHDLKADLKDSIHFNRVTFYHYQDNTHNEAPEADLSNKWAGGGFLCSAEDLSRYAYAHTSPGFLEAATLEEFTASQQLSDGSLTGYGIGFGTGKEVDGDVWYGHSGGSVGGTSMMIIYPEKKLVVVTLINRGGANMNGLAQKIADFMEKTGS